MQTLLMAPRFFAAFPLWALSALLLATAPAQAAPGDLDTLSPPNWQPFPFLPAGTSINAQGQVEFLFTAPGNAALFRLQAY
jgi:hypothetical protein